MADAAIPLADHVEEVEGKQDENLEKTHVSALPRYENVNPFKSRTSPYTCYEMTKIIFMTITFIPIIRFIIIILLCLLMWLFAGIASCGHDHKKPMGACRRLVVQPIRLLSRLCLFVAGFYWIRTKDMRKSKKRARIIVANHISMFDNFKINWDTGCAGAAKAELFGIPIVGSILRSLQTIPVYRESPEQRKKAILAIKERADNPQWPPLLVFPEGTTSVDSMLISFKRGPFVPGIPVQPVCISYPNKHNDLYLGDSMGWSLYWALCQFVNYARFDYLEVYEPNEEEKKDPQLFADHVRAIMAKHMKLPTTEFSFLDYVVMMKARKGSVIARKTGVHGFAINDADRMFHMSYGEISAALERFKQFDKDHDKAINYEEFCASLGIEPKSEHQKGEMSTLGERLFNLFDADENGQLDFSEFIAAMAIMSKQCSSPNDQAKVLFHICDADGKGIVTKQQFVKMLGVVRHVPKSVLEQTNVPEEERETYDLGISTSDIVDLVFPDPNETQVNMATFVQRMESHPQTASNVLCMFMWKRTGDLK